MSKPRRPKTNPDIKPAAAELAPQGEDGVGAPPGDTADTEAPIPPDFYGVTSGRDEAAVLMLFRRLRSGPIDELRFGNRALLRDHLVLVHAPLVEHCARSFMASGEPVDDLVQQGYVGLIKAVDRYDPEKGVRFSTYACHLITGEIRHYLRDLGKLIHEPGWHFELRQRISRVSEQMTQRLSRAPEPEEIATALNVRLETVQDVLRSQHVLTVDSLDEPANDNDEGGSGADWIDEAGLASAPQEGRVDDRMMLGSALPQLRDLEKRVVSLFFFEELSKTEIARRLNISVNYAGYLVKRGLEHLRQIIEAGETMPSEIFDGSSWPQQRARAGYLLTLAAGNVAEGAAPTGRRGKARSATGAAAARDRRTAKQAASVPAVRRSKVAPFPQFVSWLDDEVERASRYAQEFAVLWLQVRNWKEATSELHGQQAEHAMAAIEALMRRHSRTVDRVGTLTSEALPGLHFLVLMPHTGVRGRKVGERWLDSCRSDAAYLADPAAVAALEPAFAFAVFPEDGKVSDELFRNLGEQLNLA